MIISTQRWKGRLDATIPLIAQRGVPVQQGSTYLGLRLAILESGAFSKDEISAFESLMVKGLAESGESYDPNGETLGRLDFEYVRNHFPQDIFTKLAEDTDYVALYNMELEQIKQRRRQKRKRFFKILAPIVVLIVLGISIYNLPYFAEKRAYARTLESPSMEAFACYIDKYDNHEHLPDVLYRYGVYLLHGDDIFSCDKARERQCIEALDSLIKVFPDYELSKRANVTIDSIWDNELSRYTERNPNIQSSKSLSAMYEMLQYMKQNKIYDIRLNVKSDVDLKEYSDFPQEVRSFLEFMYPELSENPVLKIKDYFGTPDQESLERSLVEEFRKAVNSLFTPDSFSIVTSDEDGGKMSNLPVIDLGYSIKSQVVNSYGIDLPDIWTYSSTTAGLSSLTTEKHIMGIEVSFDAKLSFPGQKMPWDLSIKGSPEEDINDIDDISDGYRVMTQKCFDKFGEQLSTLLGVADK